MVFDKVSYIFALAFLYISYSECTFTECEKNYLPQCGHVFVSTWKNADPNADISEEYCKAFQSYGKCLSEDSRSCSGTIIGLLRQGIADHLLVNKKTALCPNMDFSALIANLEALAKANIPSAVASLFNLKKLDGDVAEACDIKASRECANYIAGNFINHFKANQGACLAKEADEYIFTCFEAKGDQCNGKLTNKFRETIKKIGKLIMDEQRPLLDNC
ncbi:uncharacterized protein LOC110251057 [Exaiptasia diaphana]|uniref:Repulsive guidance molecule N-terminal domain-containing protein n=1 Tax=Exaiptasia diaphana TaxID=2652724 RepID=A0A913Y2B0_EXADI|nr:uncharacterized protein LOC110251057 [Exaiptasia diaphana]KXJ23219.1 hypothetical protein AC249_AIPGENE3848 [Exaiptasia diaphana]